MKFNVLLNMVPIKSICRDLSCGKTQRPTGGVKECRAKSLSLRNGGDEITSGAVQEVPKACHMQILSANSDATELS